VSYLRDTFWAVIYVSPKIETDDSDARDVGGLYDIEVHGTAGIVARARQSGLLSYEETRQVMHDLHERSSLYLTERVYRIVMEMIEKG